MIVIYLLIGTILGVGFFAFATAPHKEGRWWQFTLRDMGWFAITAGIGLGCYKHGRDKENAFVALQIDRDGFYNARKAQAYMFPVYDETGADNRMMRVYSHPVSGKYEIELHARNRVIQHGMFPASEQ